MEQYYSPKINQLRDYSSLFSRNEVIRWFKKDMSSVNSKIQRYKHFGSSLDITYLDYLREIYEVLKKSYLNEYVFKNEFINVSLIKELKKSKTVIFNEFRVGNAIADLAIFNGISRAFEIKTKLDKDVRLNNQLKEYNKLFNEIYVVAPKSSFKKYLNLECGAGVIFYDEESSDFIFEKKAKKNDFIDVDILMKTFHTKEYIMVVENYYGFKPKMNDFNKFDICKELIGKIPQDFLNNFFLNMMKIRNINNEFLPEQSFLNQMFLSLNLSIKEMSSLIDILSSKIDI